MRNWICAALLLGSAGVGALVAAENAPGGGQEGVQQQSYRNMTPAQRAEATRTFLGLGAPPDKAAAALGAPLFVQSCAFCHGQNARGATGPSLITSDVVLEDDRGEHLVPFLKKGRPEKGMPAFSTMSDQELTDVAEFLHLQVEDVANRGAYHVLNILVGDPARGKTYFQSHCTSCHAADTFAHIASNFRSPEQLQRNWIWPAHQENITATVQTPAGIVSGKVMEISDFRIVLVDGSGQTQTIDRGPGVEVKLKNSLAGHENMLGALTNDDMHNVTAYLETLK